MATLPNYKYTRDLDNPLADPHENQGITAQFYEDFVPGPGGTPVAKEMVQFFIAGDSKMRPVKRASDRDRQRFPKAYQAYKEGKQFVHDGTRLEDWRGIDEQTMQHCKMRGVHTVEQLAAVGDNFCSSIMGGFQLRQRAQGFVSVSATTSAQKERDELKARLANIESQGAKMEAMQAELDRLRAKEAERDSVQEKRGPGRPRKTETKLEETIET